MAPPAIDLVLSMFGCAVLVLTAAVCWHGRCLQQRLLPLNLSEQTSARWRLLLRTTIGVVALGGIVAATTFPFDLSQHAGVSIVQQHFRKIVSVIQMGSLAMFVVGAATLCSIERHFATAIQSRRDETH